MAEMTPRERLMTALRGGVPDRVPCFRKTVRWQAIIDAGADGGYIIGTGEAVAPETSADSLRAAVQATKDFGVYGRDL